MSKILPLPAREVVKALENLGLKQIRQKGSHLFLQHQQKQEKRKI